jgi:hypothetical protein
VHSRAENKYFSKKIKKVQKRDEQYGYDEGKFVIAIFFM